MATRSIVVSQRYNARYDASKPKDGVNSEYIYLVDKAVNVLDPRVGEYLLPARVQFLIDQGINVTIVPPKAS